MATKEKNHSLGKELFTAMITTGAFISYNVGAGFASGNELLQFFGSWDPKGIVLAVVSGFLLLIWICTVVYMLGYQSPEGAATDSFVWMAGKGWGTFYKLCTDIMVLGCFMLMFSGSSNLFSQQFGLSKLMGAILLGVVTLIVTLGGLKVVETALGWVGVIILVYMAIFVLVTLFGGKSDPALASQIAPAVESGKILRVNLFNYFPFTLMPSLKELNNPVLTGALYSTELYLCGFPFFITLGKRAGSKKQTIMAALSSSFTYYFCIVCVLVMIAFNFDAVVDSSTGQMFAFPALSVVNKLWPGAGGVTYAFLIFAGIFSTAIGYLWVMSDRVFPNQEKSMKNKIFIIVMTAFGIFVGDKIPFSMLINVLFPFIGVAGIMALISGTIKLIQIKNEKE